MASIVPTEKGYRVFVFKNNIRRSKTFRLKREAEAWGFQQEKLIADSVGMSPGDANTVRQLLEKYRDEVTPTKRGNAKEYIRINAMLASGLLPLDKSVSECTPDDLGQWRDARLRQVSAGSVLREFSTLSAIFETARLEWRWITVNPVRDVRKPRDPDHRTVTISRQQIKLMLQGFGYSPTKPIRSISQACGAAFVMALRTGMRAGEICGLTWSNMMDDYCKLPVTKSKPREVPLSDRAVRLVKRMEGFDSALVFGIKAQTLDAMFRKIRARQGLEGFTFHDSRHTAATWMSDRVDVLTLCKIFGWSNTKQALTYYNPKASHIARRLSGPKGGQSRK